MEEESTSEFSLPIVRIAVAQICQSVGYNAARTSALDTLGNIATCYLKAVAKSAADSANSCGRTHSNSFDVVVAFEDLIGSVEGFSGASSWSKLQSSITSSSLLKDIEKFVLYSDEIPFAQPLLPRKIFTRHPRIHRKEKASYNYKINLGHVPRWLPEMPAIEEMKDAEIEKSLGWDFRVQNTVGEGERNEGGKGEGDGKGLHYLPKKRQKVRFQMGLKGNTGGGVLSRVGIGKRVLCHNLGAGSVTSDGIEENERKKKTGKMKMLLTSA